MHHSTGSDTFFAHRLHLRAFVTGAGAYGICAPDAAPNKFIGGMLATRSRAASLSLTPRRHPKAEALTPPTILDSGSSSITPIQTRSPVVQIAVVNGRLYVVHSDGSMCRHRWKPLSDQNGRPFDLKLEKTKSQVYQCLLTRLDSQDFVHSYAHSRPTALLVSQRQTLLPHSGTTGSLGIASKSEPTVLQSGYMDGAIRLHTTDGKCAWTYFPQQWGAHAFTAIHLAEDGVTVCAGLDTGVVCLLRVEESTAKLPTAARSLLQPNNNPIFTVCPASRPLAEEKLPTQCTTLALDALQGGDRLTVDEDPTGLKMSGVAHLHGPAASNLIFQTQRFITAGGRVQATGVDVGTDLVAAVDGESRVWVWKASSGRLVSRSTSEALGFAADDPPEDIRPCASGYVLIRSRHRICAMKAYGRVAWSRDFESPCTAWGMNRSGDWILRGDTSGSVMVLSLLQFQTLQVCSAGNSPVTSLHFDADERYVFTGCANGNVVVMTDVSLASKALNNAIREGLAAFM